MKATLQNNRGIALTVVMMVTVLLLSIVGVSLSLSQLELKKTSNLKLASQAFYAAEAGSESGVSLLRQLLNNKLHVSTSDLNIAAPTLSGYAFDVFSIEKEGSMVATFLTSGNYAQLTAYIQRYKITSEAKVTGTDAKARILQHAVDYLIPLFQFGIFYEEDLEILPGPDMTFSNGRIHSNSDMYLGANSSLSIDSLTTSAGNVFNRRKNNGAAMPGTVQIKDGAGDYQEMNIDSDSSDWKTESQNIWDGRIKSQDHGIQGINLPLPSTNTPIDIIKNCDIADTQELKEAKFCWKAGLKIIDGVAYDKNDNVLDLSAGGNNPLSTETFWDRRENANIQVSTIDMDKLNSNTIAMAALNNPPPGEDAGILYAYRSGADQGIRLHNGSTLPSIGLTVASEQPIYVQGDYNVNNGPAAVIGDAVNILSNNWDDTNSQLNLTSNRVASNTTVKGAIMTGHVETEPNAGHYSGGVENLPRFLEDWTDKTFTYSGSLVSLWFSEHGTKRWKYGAPVYKAPDRNWSYGIDLSNMPPGTPRVRVVEKTSWFHGYN
jgi:hypothetical protein